MVLYGGIPPAVALYATLNNWHLLAELGLPRTLFFYLGHTLPWYLTALLSAGVMRLLAPWRPGLVTITTLGSLLACLPAVPYAVWLTSVLAPGLAELHTGGWSDPAGTILYSLRATAIWVLVNLVFDRYLGLPRYRYGPSMVNVAGVASLPVEPADSAVTGPASPPTSPPLPPAFLQRLSRPLAATDLLAIKAEQHYIKVIGPNRSELVLYRLGDAVRELPPEAGIQVHRSWWVNRSAVANVEASGRRMVLRLVNGATVPVSAPYQALVRQNLGRPAR